MFWDNVEISVKAGKGGDGLVSFRHERGQSLGGPDGGDGGDGGSVVIEADSSFNTLADYARQREFAAKNGSGGGKANRHGKTADDLILKVPVGTLAFEGDRQLADLAESGASFRVARGGRGGFGNAHFTSSVRQSPRQAELGEPGERRDLKLELKLVADVGLVGLPSVGKSTLLARLTAATPKIADYPFTTTVPQLGIAKVDDSTLVLADIPGLIAGAHKGKGLGDAFLRHIERTKVIVHLLDATAKDPVAEYETIRNELESFSSSLVTKPELIALNKSDTLDDELKKLLTEDVARRLGRPVELISAVSGDGVEHLLRAAAVLSARHRPEPDATPAPVFTLADLAPQATSVKTEGAAFRVSGRKIERLAAQTDFDNPEAAERFWWIFGRMGAGKQLEKLGARPAATIKVGEAKLSWPG